MKTETTTIDEIFEDWFFELERTGKGETEIIGNNIVSFKPIKLISENDLVLLEKKF